MITKETAYKIFKGAWILFLIANVAEMRLSGELDLVPFMHVSEIPLLKYFFVLLFALVVIPAKEFIKILKDRRDLVAIILLMLLLLVGYVSSFYSDFPDKAFSVTNRIAFYFIIFLIVLSAIKYFNQASSFILKSFIYINVLIVIGSLLDFFIPDFHQLLVTNFGRPEAFHSIMKVGGKEIMRPMGFLTDSNLTAFSVGFSLLLLLLNHKHFNKIFTYSFYISGAFVFGMLSSRAALLMCIITVIVFFTLRVVNKKELIVFTMLFVLLQAFTPQTYSRILFYFDKEQVEEEFAVGRPVIWEAAYNYFKEKPVIGAGPGVFFEVSREYIVKILERNPGIDLDRPGEKGYHQVDRLNPHNIFLVMLTETGLVGLMLFLALIVYLSFSYLLQKKILSFIFMINILIVSALSNFAPYYKFYLIMCIMFYAASSMNIMIKPRNADV